MRDVQAVILAGGKGTRLRPVTAEIPKPLIPIANKPLISHQLADLAAAGVRDVTLALGYNAARFADVQAGGDRLGLSVRAYTEPVPLGTGGALRYCADQGAFDDRPLLWLNGDVVASPDVATLLAEHGEHDALVTLWLTSVRDVSEFGVLELDAESRVRRFLEKPSPDETDSRLVNAGILLLDPAVLARIPAGEFFSFESGLLPRLVAERAALYGHFDGGYWLDTGRPEHYRAANRHVMEGRVAWEPAGTLVEEGLWEGDGVQRGDTSVIRPAVLGDGVRVEPGARLFGRTVLGDRVRVGAGALLENCVVFDDVVIGQETEIVDAVVCAGARLGAGVVVDGSIVGARCDVGDRNELRGARLDSDVRLHAGALRVDQ